MRASAGVFAERGLAETTVEDLLRAAGVSRRTFYKSFANKEAVLAAVYDARTALLLSTIRARPFQRRQPDASGSTDASSDARSAAAMAALVTGLNLYLDYHAKSGPLLLVLIEEAGRSGSLLAPRRQALREELIAFMDEAAGGADRLLCIAMLSALEGLSLHLLRSDFSKGDLGSAKRIMKTMLERLLGAD